MQRYRKFLAQWRRDVCHSWHDDSRGGFEVLDILFIDNDVLNVFKWKALFTELDTCWRKADVDCVS